jgi:ribose transport system ATP-binding protein
MKQSSQKTIQMVNISKRYFGVQAVDGVDFDLESGVVHAIVGENGAGKSTLMKILSGVVKRDAGEIIVNGRKAQIQAPIDAIKNGISIIEQEFSLFLDLNIYQNIFLGHEYMKGSTALIDWKGIRLRSKQILQELGLDVDLSKAVRFLTTSEQQIIEIAKSCFFGADFLIMDEPTSALSEKEKLKLFQIIRNLKAAGVGIIYISHRMEEIFDIADRVTVMRDGKKVGTFDIGAISSDQIISLMVGREVTDLFRREHPTDLGRAVLEVRNLYKRGSFRDISFSVRAGEIVGLCGLMGAQRTEIVRCIYGADKFDAGEVLFLGTALRRFSTKNALKAGIGFVPEDRKRDGIIHTMSVSNNLALASLPEIQRLGWLRMSKQRTLALEQVKDLDIKTVSVDQSVSKLSGGNQQKVVLGRFLALKPKLLILDEPTRGIDVGAKQEVHKIIDTLARSGIAVLLISSELPEILGASDRIIVLNQGRITGEYSHEQASPDIIMERAVASSGTR